MNIEQISLMNVNYGRQFIFQEQHVISNGEFAVMANSLRLKAKGTYLLPGDMVLFSKYSKVPRFKFGEYAKTKSLKKVLSLDKASAVAIDVEYFLSQFAMHTSMSEYIKCSRTWFTGLANHSWPEEFYIQPASVDYIKKALPTFGSNVLEKVKLKMIYRHCISIMPPLVKELNDLYKTTKTIISDNSILGDINQGIEIDTAVYAQLQQMITSGEKGNVSLAMELMANADYRKSELKIALLLNRFYADYMATNASRNLVNFKSMLSYFDKYNWNSKPVYFAEGIIRETKDDMEDKEERLELAKKSVLDWLNKSIPGTMFKVEEIIVKI